MSILQDAPAIDKVAAAVRRAHFGFAPHAGPKWEALPEVEREAFRDQAREIIQHAVMTTAARDDETAHKAVCRFLVENFGVALDA